MRTQLAAVVCAALLCGGCVDVAEVRTMHQATAYPLTDKDVSDPTSTCSDENSTPSGRSYAQEDYPNGTWASFVEFDDEGWLLNPNAAPNEVGLFAARLEKEVSEAGEDTSFVIVSFVHGWHHNAHDTDCNVHEFRAMLDVVAHRYGEISSAQHKTKVIGLYIAWRGESLSLKKLNVLTVVDRQNAAERVAKGDIRNLFAVVRKVAFDETIRHPKQVERVRTVVLGHSFGGLIAFNALSPAVLNQLTLNKPEPDEATDDQHPCVSRASQALASTGARDNTTAMVMDVASVFPDLLVLINPALEATRFEDMHWLSLSTPNCPFPTYRGGSPKVIVVTADNDEATGKLFTAARTVETVLHAYPKSDTATHHNLEREASLHAIGFVDRYKTHRLCFKQDSKGVKYVVGSLIKSQGDAANSEPYSPVWVVGAPREVIDGHNGFFYADYDPNGKHSPLLLNWLLTLHIDALKGQKAPTMEGVDCDQVALAH